MFALFFSLYMAMLRGRWIDFSLTEMNNMFSTSVNKIGEFLTSIFNNVSTPMTDLGTSLFTYITFSGQNIPTWMALLSLVLAFITSIGIVVMAVKGIKRVFGVFFMGVR